MQTTLTPTQPSERIQVIDVLRGFALLGILLVNMDLFARPGFTIMLPLEATASGIERVAHWLVRFLAEGKFYSLFSFLFGLGFAMQMIRGEERGAPVGWTYVRRLLVLLAIGLIHAYLIWTGDILTLYALLGFVLLLFRRAKPRTLIIWAVILILLPVLFMGLSTFAIELGRQASPQAAEINRTFEQQRAQYLADIERAYRVYSQGNFIEITQQRAYEIVSFSLISSIFLSPSVLAMFLVGLYFGRQRIFQNLEAHIVGFRRLMWWGLGIGVIGNLIYATLIPSLARGEPSMPLVIATLGQAIGAPMLCLFYVAALVLLYRSPMWQKRLDWLAPTGRLALTNYLGQSIICTLIFYGYGLGWFGRVDRATGVGLAIVIYVFQVLLSAWWVKRFRYGPAEWLWRSLTYLKPQPFRV
ncbi:MAG: DUF418 domain-containing protein [Anaerolineae bacterium]|nr:DUF418 domain-containing protein [Anaerolineae bacterium]